MTETEWEASTRADRMLDAVRERAGDRRLRLFALACWEQSVHYHGTWRERDTLLAMQQFADGQRTREAVLALAGKPEWAAMAESAWDAAVLWATQAIRPNQLLREIFGNPFRPVAVEAYWRTGNVVGLAQAIYQDHAFDRMPILADALEDAGCTNEVVLAHCRGEGPHVPGCWVVDLVLGKE
jgi:hypothetical protein